MNEAQHNVRAILRNAHDFDWSLQGFGMFRAYLCDMVRVHVWDSRFRVQGVSDVHDHPYLGQFQYFVDCIRANRRPHNDLAHCAHVHEVCFAIQQAVKARKAVKVLKTPGT